MAQTPLPSFPDLVSKAESFELFQKSLDSSGPPTAAFTATNHGQPCLTFKNLPRHQSVPTTGRAAVHHAAKSAARKGTTLISATIDMHEVENLLAPQPTLPRPLKPSALLMGSSLMTGTWTQGLRPT
ncbi:hypothetical protein PVL29_001399 [Vitis rotundifolia]|uniref:Uncharacterized protein n=1 Tax=Vitis rotundifolia TaxID=103349 RepID=A0AA39AN79_VITRO|nr:hypothetical protein PVL29_001399 [Vitis rotundifolia]